MVSKPRISPQSNPQAQTEIERMARSPPTCASLPDETPEFFKVFLPKLSSKHMSIPPAFVKQFIRSVPKQAILKDHTGKSWHVGLESLGGALCVTTGWEGFVNDIALKSGDFLIFKYDGDTFDFKIFGINGCKKGKVTVDTRRVKQVKNEEIEEQIHCRPTHTCKQTDFEMGCNVGEKSGSSVQKETQTKRKHAKVKVEGDAGDQKPVGPYFLKTITRWSRYAVYVPRALLKAYNIKLKPDVMLRNQNDKLWPVKISFKDDGSIVLATGWERFRRKNVKVGQTCQFVFVLGRGNICKEMQVRVIRGSARGRKGNKKV